MSLDDRKSFTLTLESRSWKMMPLKITSHIQSLLLLSTIANAALTGSATLTNFSTLM